MSLSKCGLHTEYQARWGYLIRLFLKRSKPKRLLEGEGKFNYGLIFGMQIPSLYT